jgi:hypothetical protein
MKKLLLLTMIAVSALQVSAQELKKVETAYMINRFEDAKIEVDKVMADPKQKDKPEALYWKAKVSAAFFKDAKLRDKSPTTLKDADEAYKKYIASDPAFAKVKEKGAEGFFDMYATGYELGIKQFNDKKWDDAANFFKITVEYGDLIFTNKWSNKPIVLDTIPNLYLAYAYQNANKPADAAKYYARLADSKVSGENYLDVYRFLAQHFTTTKNEAGFKKYVAIGRELYPKYPWDEVEIDYMDQNLSLAEKTALYDKEDAAGTLTEIKYLQFGDIFVNAPHKDKTMDSVKGRMYDLKAAEAYKKAFAKNPQNGIASFNVGVIYYNIYGDYDDQYAANIRTMQGLNADRPVEKDPKKKAAADALYKQKTDPIKQANAVIEKPLMENLDLSVEWLEKSYMILKDKSGRNATEKSVINKSVDFLANLYAYKRDRMRGKDAKAFDAFDTKYKEYDGLHAKF